MAKKDTAPAAAPGTTVAPVAPPKNMAVTTEAIDSNLLRQLGRKDALKVEKDDVAIPFLRIAQSMTKQTKKAEESYIPGLVEGNYFNSGTTENFGDEIEFQVIAFMRSYVEFKVREKGGGIVQDHGQDGSAMPSTIRDDRNRSILPNGNQLVLSFLYYGNVIRADGSYDTVAFPLAGTQIKKAKKWNSWLRALRARDADGEFDVAPYYVKWHLKGVPEKNDQGSWIGVSIDPAFEVILGTEGGQEAFLYGAKMAEMIAGGKAKVDAETILEPLVQQSGEDDDIDDEGRPAQPQAAAGDKLKLPF